MDESEVVDIEEHEQAVNIEVNVPSQIDDSVSLTFRDAESGEEVGSASGNGHPVPEEGDIVALSEATITIQEGEQIGDSHISNMTDLYEVVSRKFVYADFEVEIEDQEEPATISRCMVFVDVEEFSKDE